MTTRIDIADSTSNATRSGDAINYSGQDAYFGLHGRIAVHLGGTPSRDTGRRVGLTLAVDLHPTFAQGSVVMFVTGGAGVEWY